MIGCNDHGRLSISFDVRTQADRLKGSPLSRAERRDQQTQRILEAAKACFVRSGFQGASMQQICAEAGMSPGALYRYFPSKEAIVEAICEADRSRTPSCSPRSCSNPDVVDGLVGGAMAHIRHIHENGNAAPLFAEIRAESMRNEAIRDTCDAEQGAGRRTCSAAISAAPSSAARSIRRSSSTTLLPSIMAIGEGMALNDLPALGVPLDKLEIARPRHGRRHAAADQQIQRRPDRPIRSRTRVTSMSSQVQSLACPADGAARRGRARRPSRSAPVAAAEAAAPP